MHICLVAVYWTGIAGGNKNKKPGYTRVHLCVHLYNVKLKKLKSIESILNLNLNNLWFVRFRSAAQLLNLLGLHLVH